ncbi:sialidase, partial [Frederiksenia canicola]
SMLKNKKYNPSVALGLNTDISENSAVGIFFEQRSKEGKTKTVGLRAKYDNNNNTLSSFVRYRSVKHEDIAGKNNNVDLYLNYARQFAVDNQLTVSPFVGVYGSFSSRTLLDEDVAMNKRFVFGGDVGINIGYQLSGVKVDIRPSVALLNDSSTLSQANYEQNQYEVKSSNLVYGLTTSIEKKFKNMSVGSKIKLQKYGSQSSDVNIGVNLSYNW